MESSDVMFFIDAIFDNVAIGMALLNDDGRFVRINSALRQMLGYEEAEFLAFDYSQVTYPDDLSICQYLFSDLFAGRREQFKIEKRFLKKNGSTLWVYITSSIVHEKTGTPKYAIITVEDISRRKEAEEALISEKKRLAITLESIGDGVITTNILGNIIMINKAAEDLTGWTQMEAAGQPLETIFYLIDDHTSEPLGDPVSLVLKNGKLDFGLNESTVLVAKDGVERFISATGAPIRNTNGENIGVVFIFRDITGKKKLDQEFLRMQKLESVGVLAGGIAHDFNNIMAAILANIQLAKMLNSNNKDITKNLNQIEDAIKRATNLTKQLLTFSKGGAPVKKAASIAELIRETADFALHGSNVKCEYTLPENLGTVEMDEGQISQVINNLIINADQAMPEGGIIKVQAEDVFIGSNSGLPLETGNYVKISVTDSGVGIPEALHQKIYDPYFTTKEKGNGLGLATSYSIIKSHDGYIDLKSKVGVGTTFNLYLPFATGYAGLKEKPAGVALAGKGKILIMDDETEVSASTGEILMHLGYKVELARDGMHAINLYRQAKDLEAPYDAVIMDLTIPGGMGGKETIKRMAEFDPNVKAIVISGYTEDPVLKEFRKHGFCGMITKPYKIEDLSEILRQVL